MSCLDETTVARLLDRTLTPNESASVVGHIDGCVDCRRLVSALAHVQVDDLMPPAPAIGSAVVELTSFARGFAPPTGPAHVLDLEVDVDGDEVSIGRYRLTRHLGRGAMGAVYAAYDPELGRQIAIKLVPLGSGLPDDARSRLLREAKALAKVSHPNVVAVYDVGSVDEHLFIAMELVSSGTLREWLAKPRTLEAIVAVMIDVGRGLAAAHACGLAHRDVKPDNVLIDPQGRVRISDFGLVSSIGDARPAYGEPVVDPRASAPLPAKPAGLPPIDRDAQQTLTQTGGLVGTPAYMAPEQFVKQVVDARSDQFSFCVTLHEAIYGVRPFAGETVEALSVAVASERPPSAAMASGRRVPRWLRAAIDRGLALDPAARYPSMDALVAALGGYGRRRVRTVSLLVAGAALGIVGVIALRDPTANSAAQCSGTGDEIQVAWNPTAHHKLTTAFAATSRPFAGDTASKVADSLDRYAGAWTAKRREVCTATRVRGDQPEAVMELRNDCLDARRRDLAALVDVFGAADGKLVTRAIDAVGKLPPLEQCDDVAALRQQQPPATDPVTAARIRSIRGQLSTLAALALAGRGREANNLAQELVDVTRELDAPDVRVAALSRLAELVAPSKPARARSLLEEAIATADRGRIDHLRAEVWAQLVSMLAAREDDLPAARQLLPQAAAAVARLGTAVGPTLEVKWLNAQGTLLAQSGDPRAAADKFRLATVRAAARLGETAPLYVLSATNLAGAELQLATPQARAASASRILELHVRLYGEHHPKTADARMTLGETLMALGKADDAIAALRIAIADLVASNGPDDAGVADARTRLAGALQMLGRLDDATTENERALEIRRKRFPPGHPFIVESLVQRGRLQGASGKHADALATLADARDKLVANHGSDLELADVEKDLGYESGQLGKLADAEARYRHALALEEAALGKDSPVLAGGLRQLGTVLVRAKRNRDAIAVLERSLAIEIRGEGDPVDLADVRMQLALALEGDQKRALELATLALDTYTKLKLAEPRAEAAALVTKLSTKR